MNIGKTSDAGQAPAPQRTASASGARPAVGAPVASGSPKIESSTAADSVTLSDASRTMIARQSGGDEVRSARVAELKLAIDEGRYRPDAGRIADRLLEEVAELQPRRGPRP